MLFIIWIVIGGILGWLASMVMKTDAEQGMILNIVVGIVGAFLGGWLLSPLFGTGTINSDDFSVSSLLVSFLGAVILLAIVNLLRRGRVRCVLLFQTTNAARVGFFWPCIAKLFS